MALAEIAVRRGWVTREQIVDAMREQGSADPPRALADILLERGWLTRPQLREVMDEVSERVERARAKETITLTCPVCQSVYRVPAKAGGKYRCKSCWETLVDASAVPRAEETTVAPAGQATEPPGAKAGSQETKVDQGGDSDSLRAEIERVLRELDQTASSTEEKAKGETGEETETGGGIWVLPETSMAAPEEAPVGRFEEPSEPHPPPAGPPRQEETAVPLAEKPVEDPLLAEVARAEKDRQNVVGKFVLLELVGQGAMGDVWRAYDREGKRQVALKLLKGADADDVRRLQREAEIGKVLRHPNIVETYEIGDADGRPYLAMQYVDGVNLRTKILGIRQALQAISQVCRALQAAHSQGIVHRDIKPGNLIMDRDGKVFITDLGIARPMSTTLRLKRAGEGLYGTPGFMSPEQAMGRQQDVDAKSDIFSIGATLYFLLTGTDPFPAADSLGMIKKIIDEEPVPPRKVRPEIPAEVEKIVLKALRKDRAKRYPTAADMAADIDRWLAGAGETQVGIPAAVVDEPRPSGRGKWVAMAAALVVAVVGAGIGLGVIGIPRKPGNGTTGPKGDGVGPVVDPGEQARRRLEQDQQKLQDRVDRAESDAASGSGTQEERKRILEDLWKEASAQTKAAESLGPEFAQPAFELLGRIAFLRGEAEEAYRHFSSAILLRGTPGLLRRRASISFREVQRQVRSLGVPAVPRLWAERTKSDLGAIRTGLTKEERAHLHLLDGRWQEAMAIASSPEESESGFGPGPRQALIADCLFLGGAFQEAAIAYGRARELVPGDDTLLLGEVSARIALGSTAADAISSSRELEKAQDVLDAFRKRNPAHTAAGYFQTRISAERLIWKIRADAASPEELSRAETDLRAAIAKPAEIDHVSSLRFLLLRLEAEQAIRMPPDMQNERVEQILAGIIRDPNDPAFTIDPIAFAVSLWSRVAEIHRARNHRAEEHKALQAAVPFLDVLVAARGAIEDYRRSGTNFLRQAEIYEEEKLPEGTTWAAKIAAAKFKEALARKADQDDVKFLLADALMLLARSRQESMFCEDAAQVYKSMLSGPSAARALEGRGDAYYLNARILLKKGEKHPGYARQAIRDWEESKRIDPAGASRIDQKIQEGKRLQEQLEPARVPIPLPPE